MAKKTKPLETAIKGIEQEILVHCKYDDLADIKSLVSHPKNPNKHGQDQIERLVELYKYHGIRHPIIVSKKSKYIVAGHGRKLAAIRAGLKEFPVVYQDFENEDAEYAFLVSDNAIGEWAELDFALINDQMKDFDPSFDINFLGIKNFTLDMSEKDFDPPDSSEAEKAHKLCPHCGEEL